MLFIDRNQQIFGAVLEFLRTGEYFLPPGVSWHQMCNELNYYGLPNPFKTLEPPFSLPHKLAAQRAAFFFFRTWKRIAFAVKDAMQHVDAAGAFNFYIEDGNVQVPPPSLAFRVPFLPAYRVQHMLSVQVGLTVTTHGCSKGRPASDVTGCHLTVNPYPRNMEEFEFFPSGSLLGEEEFEKPGY